MHADEELVGRRLFVSSLRIRRAVAEDAAAASAIAVRAKASWGYPKEWIDAWAGALTISATQLDEQLGFVAEDGKAVVAVCVLDVDAEVATLEHLWVEPGVHGLGVGRALLEEAFAALKSMGIRKLEVESDPSAEPFYLRLGARRVAAIEAAMPGAPDRVLPLLEFVLE